MHLVKVDGWIRREVENRGLTDKVESWEVVGMNIYGSSSLEQCVEVLVVGGGESMEEPTFWLLGLGFDSGGTVLKEKFVDVRKHVGKAMLREILVKDEERKVDFFRRETRPLLWEKMGAWMNLIGKRSIVR